MNPDAIEALFLRLLKYPTEEALDHCLSESNLALAADAHWCPLDDNESNFGIIENQQSSPIAALIEKITNSIDAILMRRCYEAGIDPKSPAAPKSMEEAIHKFFHPESQTWYLSPTRQKQAEEIQILADGPRMNTSLLIYHKDEGQNQERT